MRFTCLISYYVRRECRKFQPIFVGSSLCIYAVPLYKVLSLPHVCSVCVWFIVEHSNRATFFATMMSNFTFWQHFVPSVNWMKIRRRERNVFMLLCWITRVTVAECAMKWLIISKLNINTPIISCRSTKKGLDRVTAQSAEINELETWQCIKYYYISLSTRFRWLMFHWNFN